MIERIADALIHLAVHHRRKVLWTALAVALLSVLSASRLRFNPDILSLVPQEDKDREARVFEQQAADKPENIRPKIVEGKLKSWYKEVVLLDQEHVNGDKHDGKTIEQLRADLSAKTGDNVVIKRFVRFAVGE